MNYDLLKKAIEDEAARQGLSEYEIYYMSSEELEVATLNNEVNCIKDELNTLRGQLQTQKKLLLRRLQQLRMFLQKSSSRQRTRLQMRLLTESRTLSSLFSSHQAQEDMHASVTQAMLTPHRSTSTSLWLRQEASSLLSSEQCGA